MENHHEGRQSHRKERDCVEPKGLSNLRHDPGAYIFDGRSVTHR